MSIIICLAFLPKDNLISEYFLVLLFIPMLIYFTNTLRVNSKILNFLGSLSFGLYAYQCVLRVLEFYIPMTKPLLFIILILLVLLGSLIEYMYKKNRIKKCMLS